MNLPITVKFFKKIELFQDLIKLNFQADAFTKTYEGMSESEKKNTPKSTWSVERGLLWWIYRAHVKLASPISLEKISIEKKDENKGFLEKYANFGFRVEGLSYIPKGSGESSETIKNAINNLVIRGYATEVDKEGIILSKTSLPMAELVSELYENIERRLVPIWSAFVSYIILILLTLSLIVNTTFLFVVNSLKEVDLYDNLIVDFPLFTTGLFIFISKIILLLPIILLLSYIVLWLMTKVERIYKRRKSM